MNKLLILILAILSFELKVQAQSFNTRIAKVQISQNLNHGETVNVRRILNGLSQGDFVESIEVNAIGNQPGAYLEVLMDNQVVGKIGLNKSFAFQNFPINKVNGVGYTRLLLRSIGTSMIESVRANIRGNQSEDSQLPPLPPIPPIPNLPNPNFPQWPQQPNYPQYPGHQEPSFPQQPNYPQHPHHPHQPGYPQQPNYPQQSGNLSGFCDDYDHRQFNQAKSLAYSSTGLDLTDTQAVQWALEYNQTHACNTISEFSNRFYIIKSVAYASNGLNMTYQNAAAFALSKADFITSEQAQNLKEDIYAIKNFAYSSNGLNLTDTAAQDLARQWADRGFCEHVTEIYQISDAYRREFHFAYSSNGLNYNDQKAKQYAISRIGHMSRCGDLFR